MIITFPWLKEHLKTSANEKEIINKLTNIGLEFEIVKEKQKSEESIDSFSKNKSSLIEIQNPLQENPEGG